MKRLNSIKEIILNYINNTDSGIVNSDEIATNVVGIYDEYIDVEYLDIRTNETYTGNVYYSILPKLDMLKLQYDKPNN